MTRTEGVTIRGSDREPESFAALFDLYFVAIHHYLARRVGPDLADELASETFAVALRERRRFDPARSGARPWLYGIAANLLRHYWRSERAAPGLRRDRARSRLRRRPLGGGRPARCSSCWSGARRRDSSA